MVRLVFREELFLTSARQHAAAHNRNFGDLKSQSLLSKYAGERLTLKF
jgi:hypothetical protein